MSWELRGGSSPHAVRLADCLRGTARLCSVAAGAPAGRTPTRRGARGGLSLRARPVSTAGPASLSPSPLSHSCSAPQREWRQPHRPCWDPRPPWQSGRGADEALCGRQPCSLLPPELAAKRGPRPSSAFCREGSVPSKQDVPRARASVRARKAGREGPLRGQHEAPRGRARGLQARPLLGTLAAAEGAQAGCPSPDSSAAETRRSDPTECPHSGLPTAPAWARVGAHCS